MRVVVLGATGNIGTALLEALAETAPGCAVVAVARRTPEEPPVHEGIDVTWRSADVTTDPLDELFEGADAVVSLTWLFHPSHHAQATWSNNVGGALCVIEAVRRCRVPALVVSSSVAAYSPRVGLNPVDESYPTHGASPAPYVREKCYVERTLDTLEAGVPDCRVVRMRPAFVFHRRTASQQRRLFAGPLVPGSVLRPGFVPVLPVPAGLVLQAVHSDDVGRAFASAVTGDAIGAFNLCADGTLFPADVARLFEARLQTVPAPLFAWALRAAWAAHLVPAHPQLFDALMQLPVMSNVRVKSELGWQPRVSAFDAVAELLEGMRGGEGYPTPPLASDAGGAMRKDELSTGVGSRSE